MNNITRNDFLKQQLKLWVEQIDFSMSHPNRSLERFESIKAFCRTFVPPDVNEEDMIHYSRTLANDEV